MAAPTICQIIRTDIVTKGFRMPLRSAQIALLLLVASAATAEAGLSCSPNQGDPQILSAPNNDSPDVRFRNVQVGLGWSLEDATDAGEGFLRGHLFDQKGRPIRGWIYVQADEWDCE